MGHIDRTLTNVEDMKKVAATGVTLELDLFGMEVHSTTLSFSITCKCFM